MADNPIKCACKGIVLAFALIAAGCQLSAPDYTGKSCESGSCPDGYRCQEPEKKCVPVGESSDGGGDGDAGLDGGGTGASDGGAGADASCGTNLDGDSKNCGACGHDCFGGACNQGHCAPVAIVSSGEPRYVAVDDKAIYWTDMDEETIWKISKDGASTKEKVLTDSAGTDIDGLVIDDSKAYFSVSSTFDGVIASVPLTGGSERVLEDSQAFPCALVRASTGDLYWVQGELEPKEAVMWRDTQGTTKQVTLEDSDDYLSLSLANGNLYIANDSEGGTLKRCTPPACSDDTLETLLTNEDGVGGATETSTHVIWCDAVIPGTLYQAQPDGKASEPITDKASNPNTLMVSTQGTYLYWLNSGPSLSDDYPQGSLMRCPMSDGAVHCDASGPETLAKDQAHIRGLIQDDTSIYWVSDGNVWRLAK